jgi:hypothetical protein
MTITPLSYEERLNSGFTHKLVLPYTDFTGLGSGSAVSLFPAINAATTIAAGVSISRCAINVSTAFTFAAGTLVAVIGDGGDDDRYLTSTTLKTAGWTETPAATKPYTYGAADTVDIKITCGAGTPATIAAGELVVFLAVNDLTVL